MLNFDANVNLAKPIQPNEIKAAQSKEPFFRKTRFQIETLAVLGKIQKLLRFSKRAKFLTKSRK